MEAEADMDKTETRRQNEARLAGLFNEYYDKIARYAFVRVRNRTEAEDIAAEVFLKALNSLESYKQQGIPMQAWIFRIAHNLVVDHFRKMAKKKTIPIDSVQIESVTNPTRTAETNVELEQVNKAMEQLTPAQREVVRLRFFGGFTSKEIGQILNKGDGAVREMQRAATQSLRNLLATDL
jgi:RNA polymerase sigma-70 factor (ECF subfamily)